MKKYSFLLQKSILVLVFIGLCSFVSCPVLDSDSSNDCIELKAIEFEKTAINGFEKAKIDKRLKALMIPKRLKTAAATTVYKGKKQKVFFKLNTILEDDGECVYKLKVNGKLIGEVQNKRIYNTDIKNGTLEEHLVNTKAFCIKKGDVIQVEFTNATNGLVPEGKLTATARGRWRSLELCISK